MLVKKKIKYIQSLGQKKFRNEERLFVAEGPKLMKELLDAPGADIREIFATAPWIDSNRQIENKYSIQEITDAELKQLSQLATPNQVVATVSQFVHADTAITPNKLALALDDIQDPGNLGTIIRIADWFGIDLIICSIGCADQYNSKVVQSTMGSISRVQLVYTDLEKWLKDHQQLTVYAAALNGEELFKMKKPEGGIIVIGNESKGIRETILAMAKHRITIPRTGEAESLNAAVATGIILSHLT